MNRIPSRFVPKGCAVEAPNLAGSLLCLLFLAGSPALSAAQPATSTTPSAVPADRWWSDAADQALTQSDTNRPGLVRALTEVAVSQREGMQFLIENMPARDLRSLPADYLLRNVSLAYEALNKAPWRNHLPKDIFLNDVLPYVCVNEKRDDWRQVLRDKCLPLIADCATPAEAAQRLNQKLFGLVNVKYSTQRRRADQSPLETMQSGLASCTGLTILLVDACRSVGVPARLVGTPMWVNLRGNHTWVEIWDGGWHFTGAAEPDPQLGRGWFTHDASQARKDVPRHAIYASSFLKTGLAFPLVWAPGIHDVSAVNVTDSYTPKTQSVPSGKLRLLVKVLDQPAGKRIAAQVTVTDQTQTDTKFEGRSRNESADLNDLLAFEVPASRTYAIAAESDGQRVRREFDAGTNQQELVVLTLKAVPTPALATMACYVPPPVTRQLPPEIASQLKEEVTEFFTAAPEKQTAWRFDAEVEAALRENEPAVRRAVWEAYLKAPIHDALRQDFDNREVHFKDYVSPYTVKMVGTRPPHGWALFIAMHGGGNTPKAVNDGQWRVMQRYYRDHPEVGGYLYLALRAPNDTWNGFYDVYVYPLVANLIRQFLLFGEVDSNKVFLMGYSHGGYGAFAIGPKMPDHFAAIHASAAAPTDGETTSVTLRNTVFSYMIGERDTAYGRIGRCQKFNEEIQKLRGDRADIYPVTMQFVAGNGHTGLPDKDKIAAMYPAVRNPVPHEVSWLETDNVIHDFFWLQAPAPGKQQQIDASCRNNHLTVTTTTNVTAINLLLDRRLVDFDKPVTLELNGKNSLRTLRPSLRTLCETLLTRGDPELAFTAKIELNLVKQ